MSVCHCLNCKKRSGSAFAAQARWPAEQVTIEGRSQDFVKVADSGNRGHVPFLPGMRLDVHYEINGKFDGLVAIPLGAFDDPISFSRDFSVWEERKHDWVEILGDDVEHIAEAQPPHASR